MPQPAIHRDEVVVWSEMRQNQRCLGHHPVGEKHCAFSHKKTLRLGGLVF